MPRLSNPVNNLYRTAKNSVIGVAIGAVFGTVFAIVRNVLGNGIHGESSNIGTELKSDVPSFALATAVVGLAGGILLSHADILRSLREKSSIRWALVLMLPLSLEICVELLDHYLVKPSLVAKEETDFTLNTPRLTGTLVLNAVLIILAPFFLKQSDEEKNDEEKDSSRDKYRILLRVNSQEMKEDSLNRSQRSSQGSTPDSPRSKDTELTQVKVDEQKHNSRRNSMTESNSVMEQFIKYDSMNINDVSSHTKLLPARPSTPKMS